MGIGKDEEAELSYRKTLEIDPTVHQAVTGLFTTLYNKKKYNDIDELLKKYDEKSVIENLKMPEDVRLFMYYFASEAYYELQLYDKSAHFWCVANKYKKFDSATKLNDLFQRIRLKLNKTSFCSNS